MKSISLSEILPEKGIRDLNAFLNKSKKDLKNPTKIEFVHLLTDYKEHLARNQVDLDYLCYYLEYAVAQKLI